MENEKGKSQNDGEQPEAEITFEGLMAQVTEDNRHDEVDFGPASGGEA
jgi:hypothetical protein